MKGWLLLKTSFLLRIFLIIAFIFAVPSLVPGIAYGEDLIEIYKLAIDKDPQFKGAAYEQQALKEGLWQAYGRLMPALSGELSFGRTSQDVVKTSNTVFQQGSSNYDTQNYTGKLSMPLFRYPLFLEVSQAKKLSKRADVDFEAAKQSLILRAAQTYTAALTANEAILSAAAEKKDVEGLYERAKIRYQSGLAPVTDYYDAKARLSVVNAEVVKVQNEYRDALEALKEITGTQVTSLKKLKESLPLVAPDPQDEEEWIRTGLERNLKLKSQQFDTEVARQEVSRQFAGHYPSVDLRGNYNRNDMGGSLYGGGAIVDSKDASVVVTIPLFEGFVVRSKTKEAEYKHMKNREMLEQQKRAVARLVSASYNGVKAAMSKAESLGLSVEAQTVLMDAKQQGYRSGTYSSLAVLDAARALYLYRRNYSQSRFEYIISTMKLRQAVGMLSETDLVAINNWLE